MAWPTKTTFVDGDVLTAAEVNNIGTNLNLYNPTSATNGQVPIANGSGSVAFGTLSVSTWQSIATSTSTASVVTMNVTGANYREIALYCELTMSSAQVPIIDMNGTQTVSWYEYSGTDAGNLYGDQNGTPFRFGGTAATNYKGLFIARRFGGFYAVQYTTTNGNQVANFQGFINTSTAMTSLRINCANVSTAIYNLFGVPN